MAIKNNIYLKRAFTLVEIMIAIILTTIVLTTAYQIWSKIQRDISRSTTRQKLQNELRKVANYMQNDFKSIKASGTFTLSQPSDTNFSFSFQKYREFKEDEKKLAQDLVEDVEYKKSDKTLVRTLTGDLGTSQKILSVHCDYIDIKRSEEAIEGLGEDFNEARNTKLNITITGMMKVPGTGEEMYHVENTSVVMRDEYNKITNKSFSSTFDLQKKDTSEIFVEDHDNDSLFNPNAGFDLDFLKTLTDDVLNGMGKSQKEMLDQTLEKLDELNEAIDDTDTGEGFWTKLWEGAKFWNTSEGEEVRGLRSELADIEVDIKKDEKDLKKIDTAYNDAIQKVTDVKSKLAKYTESKETEFLNKSTNGAYQRMSKEDKDIYKKAYEMKLQDRNITGAYNKQLEDEDDEEKKKEIEKNKPSTNEDRLKGNFSLSEKESNKITVIGEDGKEKEETIEKNTQTEENKSVLAAYQKISLDWMGVYGKEETDIGIYNAAKQLMTQADTKIDVLRMEKTSHENVVKIDTAMTQNSDTSIK